MRPYVLKRLLLVVPTLPPASIIVFVNLLVDLTYAYRGPRIRYQ